MSLLFGCFLFRRFYFDVAAHVLLFREQFCCPWVLRVCFIERDRVFAVIFLFEATFLREKNENNKMDTLPIGDVPVRNGWRNRGNE